MHCGVATMCVRLAYRYIYSPNDYNEFMARLHILLTAARVV